MKIRKWTFINVHFSKSQNTFEKTLHHHLFSVRMRHFRDLTFMLFFINSSVVTCRPLCCGFVNRQKIQKMAQKWGRLFCGILGWVFFGDVLNNMFRRDGAESFMSQTDGPKSWEAVLWNSWMGIFWGCFENMFVVYFSEMEQNRLSQPDGPKVVKVVLRDSWMGVFRGCFE